MRIVFLVIFLVSSQTTFLFSQSPTANSSDHCAAWTRIKTDSTGKPTLMAKDVIIISDDGGKTGLDIYSFLNSNGRVIVISIQAMGAGKCVDKGDKINILFDDDSILDLANTNDFNCDGSSTLYFGGGLGQKDEMSLLSSKKIKTMRVWTRDDYMQKTFTNQQAIAFMETLKCLSNAIR
jgi:hypothetical protein